MKFRERLRSLDEGGGALVEFTVIAPLFFLILFGIIEFGSIFWAQNNLVNAAREAARTVAVQQPVTATALTVKPIVCPWLPGLTYQVTIDDLCPTLQDLRVQVTTDAVTASVFNYLGLFGGNLSTRVQMRKENACGLAAAPQIQFNCP